MLKAFKDDGKLIVHKKTDPNLALEGVKRAREISTTPMSDSKHVARIDAHVLEKWVKEAGLRFDDREAVRDLIKRKLMDSDNADWRVWQRTY